jgi:hypothetical protein
MSVDGEHGGDRLIRVAMDDVVILGSDLWLPFHGTEARRAEEIAHRVAPAGIGVTRRAVCRAGLVATVFVAMGGAMPAPAAERAANPSAESARQGKQIAKTALKYKGTRYVSGGNTPKGFDCSGFTQYVVKKVLGIDIGQTVKGQWRFGDRVPQRKLREGDLVFFANTFEKGLSHVGIIVGKDRFIHAENEKTGVVISDLDSDYYSAHYRGARRLT